MHKTAVGPGDGVILTDCKQTQSVQDNPKHSVTKHVTTTALLPSYYRHGGPAHTTRQDVWNLSPTGLNYVLFFDYGLPEAKRADLKMSGSKPWDERLQDSSTAAAPQLLVFRPQTNIFFPICHMNVRMPQGTMINPVCTGGNNTRGVKICPWPQSAAEDLNSSGFFLQILL